MNELLVLANAMVVTATGTPPFSGAVVVEGDRIVEVVDGPPRRSGDATVIDEIEVHWPSGATEHFPAPQIDHIVTIKEGQGTKP